MKNDFVFTSDFGMLSTGAYKFDPLCLFAVYEYRTREIVIDPLSWLEDVSDLRDYASAQIVKLRTVRLRRRYLSFRVVLRLWDTYYVTLFYA